MTNSAFLRLNDVKPPESVKPPFSTAFSGNKTKLNEKIFCFWMLIRRCAPVHQHDPRQA
jgi:hypothetical protein